MRTTLLLLPLLFACAGPRGGAPDDSRPHRSFRFFYKAAPKDLPEGAGRVRMWVPVPVNTDDQEIGDITVKLEMAGDSASGSLEGISKRIAVGGRRVRCTVGDIENGLGRSLCVETDGTACTVELAFDVTRYETRGGGKATEAEQAAALKADRMIPLGGKVSTMAVALGEGGDEWQTGRGLYDHTLERMRYDKPAGGEWGRGDSEWACDSKHGNCTDFHSYFMALARTKEIPARFVMGFPVPGGEEKQAKVGGYHCWAYFYAGDDKGWVPVDISEADKHPEQSEFFFGALDYNRVTMTGGRDLLLNPLPAVGALNFFVYPHIEVDGKAWGRMEKSFYRINPE